MNQPLMKQIMWAWKWVQELASLDGGLYIDLFAIIFMIRLLAPLRGFPALNVAEAGMWGVTLASFAYSNNRPKQS